MLSRCGGTRAIFRLKVFGREPPRSAAREIFGEKISSSVFLEVFALKYLCVRVHARALGGSKHAEEGVKAAPPLHQLSVKQSLK